MRKIPFLVLIANAAACFLGRYGAVTRQAETQKCSRQTIYNHASEVAGALLDRSQRPSGEQLVLENQDLRRENAQLWDWLDQTVEFPQAKREEFSVRAAAMGLSLNQIAELLALIVGTPKAQARSTVHRLVKAAAVAAGKVLHHFDQQCKSLVSTACLDEIFFHGRPVFVGVEPQSMTLILAQKGERLDRVAWLKRLLGWNALRYVVCDAGTVLQSALAWLSARRQAAGATFQVSLDVFHTAKEAQRVLKILWNRVKKDWKAAEKADPKVARSKRKGEHANQAAAVARSAWTKATRSMERYDAAQAAWKMVRGAFDLFRPDGQLNDRVWAEAWVQEALPAFAGKAWTTLRNLLQAPQAFAFLDQLKARLAELPIQQELRKALIRLYWLQRSPDDGQGHKVKAILVQKVICRKLEREWSTWYSKVASLFKTMVRASSVVESVNSVLRMHQSRHRTLNQGLLDLKRLYWNTRRFRKGPRRDKCPYQLLGLKLPSYEFWTILQGQMAHESTIATGPPLCRASPC